MKAAFLILYIILFAFYLDNAFRITAYILFFIMMLIVTVFRFEYVNGIWSLLCFMVPVFGLPALLVICITCKCFKYCCKGKEEISERNARKEFYKNKLNKNSSPNANEHSNKQPPASSNQFDDLSIPADQENQLKTNEMIKEPQKVKTMKDITGQKDKYCSSSIFCVICKNKFENEETTVEIECCVLNKIHTKCINVEKDYYCNNCNANLIELTVKLHPNLPAHTENQV